MDSSRWIYAVCAWLSALRRWDAIGDHVCDEWDRKMTIW